MVQEVDSVIPGDPVKACPFGRTHQGMCHVREGVQRAYYPATTPTLPGRGVKVPCCPEYIGGIPYCQPPNFGLSCKWVTGPGGLGYDRCDNYQSYHDVAVNGELMNDPGYPQVAFKLDGAMPIQGKTEWRVNPKTMWTIGEIFGIILVVGLLITGGVFMYKWMQS